MKTYSKTKTYQGDSAPAVASWIILVSYVGILAYQFLREDNGLDSTNGMMTIYLPRVIFFSVIFLGVAIVAGKMFHWDWLGGRTSGSRKKKGSKRR